MAKICGQVSFRFRRLDFFPSCSGGAGGAGRGGDAGPLSSDFGSPMPVRSDEISARACPRQWTRAAAASVASVRSPRDESHQRVGDGGERTVTGEREARSSERQLDNRRGPARKSHMCRARRSLPRGDTRARAHAPSLSLRPSSALVYLP